MTFLLLQVHLWSWRNRIRTRLRRLRQPRYLVSFLFGAAYILFFWQPWREDRFISFGQSPWAGKPGFPAIAEVGLAAILTLYIVIAWLWPF